MKLKILFFAVLIFALASLYLWSNDTRYNDFLKTPVRAGSSLNISFSIKKGDSLNNIAKNLKEKELILNENAFVRYARSNNIDRKIIAGRFLLNQNMVIPDIAKKITDPAQGEIILTVPEGFTIKEIDQRLADLGVNQMDDFVKAVKEFNLYDKYPFLVEENIRKLAYPLEGFLFPDTYFLDPNRFKNQDLIELMLKNFQKKMPEDLIAISKLNSQSLYDVITMASIVEKEIKTVKDRPIVAGILWKRLKNGWQLGADATLLYLKDSRTIGQKQLQEDFPYNTRKNTGLPPGPISNPGLISINAAINSEPSPHFYYLTKPGSGEVVYAKTNDEHNANKAKYLKGGGEKPI